MRILLLFIALLLSSMVAPAQTLPAARSADSLALRPLAAVPLNSAAALHHLFVDKRNLRTAVVLGTVLVGGISLFIDGVFGSNNTNPYTHLAIQGRIVGLTLVAGTGELLYYRQYNREKEQLALLALELHKLSPELKRHLKPRYFLPPTSRP